MKKILFLLLLLIINAGCNSNQKEITYKTITCNEMTKLVNDGALLIDVRTEEEYNNGHIDGAINMSSTSIMDNLANVIKDKNTKIIVYCQSGGRSKNIADKLIAEDYKYVYDLGSINNCIAENIWIPN